MQRWISTITDTNSTSLIVYRKCRQCGGGQEIQGYCYPVYTNGADVTHFVQKLLHLTTFRDYVTWRHFRYIGNVLNANVTLIKLAFSKVPHQNRHVLHRFQMDNLPIQIFNLTCIQKYDQNTKAEICLHYKCFEMASSFISLNGTDWNAHLWQCYFKVMILFTYFHIPLILNIYKCDAPQLTGT